MGDMIRYTVGPLVGAALLPLAAKGMFSPLPVPERFTKGFLYGLPLRPAQIRAEAQDTAAMVSAERAAAGSGCWAHAALCRARASRRRDRGFCRQPNNAAQCGGPGRAAPICV